MQACFTQKQHSSSSSPAPNSPRASTSSQDLPKLCADAGTRQHNATAPVVDHTTSVYHLLQWPAVQTLLRSENVVKSIQHHILEDCFPMDLELSKGPLKEDKAEDHLLDEFYASLPGHEPPSDDASDVDMGTDTASPPLPEVFTTPMNHPNMQYGRFLRPVTDRLNSDLGPDGNLRMDKESMDTLLRSYLGHIHILHPFIYDGALKKLFALSYRKISSCEGSVSSYEKEHLQVLEMTGTPASSNAKKRNYSSDSGPEAKTTADNPLEETLDMAIVLLVMALGKICLHQGFFSNSKSRRIGRDSAGMISDRRVRSGDQLLHSIPGLLYFQKATQILGPYRGSVRLSHIQANVLASLYAGQVACTNQSWAWLSQACTACHLMYRTWMKKHERERHLTLFVLWTCYQLEG